MKDDLQVLLNYAYFFLKFRPRTKKEVHDYLLKKIKKRHWSTGDVDEAIKQLEERSLINDKEFVRWFVEQRARGKPKGRFVLKAELLRLGIAKDLIDQHLEENPLKEEGLALQALKSKWQRFKNLTPKARFEKSAAFLLRRGFSFEIIKQTIYRYEEQC
jgi:regulatory protein